MEKILGICMMGIFVVVYCWIEQHKLNSYKGKTTGKIFSMDSTMRQTSTVYVNFTYYVAGRQYTGRTEMLRSKAKIGMSVPVLYNENAPRKNIVPRDQLDWTI